MYHCYDKHTIQLWGAAGAAAGVCRGGGTYSREGACYSLLCQQKPMSSLPAVLRAVVYIVCTMSWCISACSNIQ